MPDFCDDGPEAKLVTETSKSSVGWGRAYKVTWEEGRREQRAYWASKTTAERLEGMAELNRNAFVMQEEPNHDPRTAFLVRRVRRG